MERLVLKAYIKLIEFDLHLARRDFPALYEKVRQCPIARLMPLSASTEQICFAVDLACIWYWKHVLCLQRSAATACLLKSQGISAEMVIGIQQMPFKAHAWVEVDGCVVNDKPYTREMYSVLDRC
jgi:hypothetical protein